MTNLLPDGNFQKRSNRVNSEKSYLQSSIAFVASKAAQLLAPCRRALGDLFKSPFLHILELVFPREPERKRVGTRCKRPYTKIK